MNPDLALLAEPRRQSPIAVVFLALRALLRVGIAQLVLVVLAITRLPVAALFTIVPLVVLALLAFSILAWWRYTFMIVDGELCVTKGVVSQDRLTVPLERVQSVSIDQQLLHRIIGLVNVKVDTAGASEAEFEIDAIERPIAEALQRLIADNTTTVGNDQPEVVPGMLPPPVLPVVERQILKRDPRRVVLAGLTRPAFAGLAFIVPLVAFGDNIVSRLGIDLPDVDEPEPAVWMLWLIPVLVIGIALVGFLANLLQILLSEWNLTLTLRERALAREAGLISRRSTATTIDRVQRFEVRRNPLEARAGIQRVALPTIGEGNLNLPGTDDAELADLRSLAIDPEATVDELDRHISPMAVFLATRNTAVAAVAIAVGLYFSTIGAWSLLALLMVPWAWWSTRRKTRLHRWGLVPEGVAQHHQLISVWTEEMMLRKVNGVTVKQSLFERKRGLATVHLQAADGGVSIGMIPLNEANAVRDLALKVAETNTKAWM